ncbi:hypothetical protein AJ78_01215 [Emergomyces pasteurianus Ep9510]|uniref:F-box domain-containing protein n=1 Tax=Emergomyces pasteurianus Ep9510 TaxID=1447872 RepID=A0A1J9PQR7_9EURO|nr:hypothetical protein AJ78_01215 [Emergomyces pasteurianus Ep9510]
MPTEAGTPAHLRATLLSLPNELIQLILEPFPILSLLPLTLICQRIHGIVALLINYRLNALVSGIGPDNIFLRCYHPVSIGPYLKCAYLHTDALINLKTSPNRHGPSQNDQHHRHSDSSNFSMTGCLGRLKNSYTHFHPLGPSGSWINTNMSIALPPVGGSANSGQTDDMLIRGSIFLDENELFSQLITGVWLERQNRRIHLLDGGVVRLWRQWLGDMDRSRRLASRSGVGVCAGRESYYTLKVRSENSAREAMVYPWEEDNSIIWLGEKRAGLRFRVCHKRRVEGLQGAGDFGIDGVDDGGYDDENIPVCYDIEIEGWYHMSLLYSNVLVNLVDPSYSPSFPWNLIFDYVIRASCAYYDPFMRG